MSLGKTVFTQGENVEASGDNFVSSVNNNMPYMHVPLILNNNNSNVSINDCHVNQDLSLMTDSETSVLVVSTLL
jgi:hypothetical protein